MTQSELYTKFENELTELGLEGEMLAAVHGYVVKATKHSYLAGLKAGDRRKEKTQATA